jgi:hypothetical protein
MTTAKPPSRYSAMEGRARLRYRRSYTTISDYESTRSYACNVGRIIGSEIRKGHRGLGEGD